jgi:hypothetical protein
VQHVVARQHGTAAPSRVVTHCRGFSLQQLWRPTASSCAAAVCRKCAQHTALYLKRCGSRVALLVAAASRPGLSVQLLLWSARSSIKIIPDDDEAEQALTQTVVYNWRTGEQQPMEVSNTDHDMFCPGITTLPTGDIVVSGGASDTHVSIYQVDSGAWVKATEMNVGRGYASSCLMDTGEVRSLPTRARLFLFLCVRMPQVSADSCVVLGGLAAITAEPQTLLGMPCRGVGQGMRSVAMHACCSLWAVSFCWGRGQPLSV